MIPYIIHYVFGMTKDFGGKPWSFIHYLCAKQCYEVNKSKMLFWYEHEPTGFWWQMSKGFFQLRQIQAPVHIHGRPLVHPAHRADVIRLQKLKEFGGFYIDSDVFCVKPFSKFSNCKFVIGEQRHSSGKFTYGLCNATMGAEPGAFFLVDWLDRYRSFRSKGRDQFWDEHSVRLPIQLAKSHPEITVVSHETFNNPLWDKTRDLFENNEVDVSQSVSIHLWETHNWEWLKDLTEIKPNTTIHSLWFQS